MPSRWSIIVLFLIALLSLVTFSRVTTSSYSYSRSSKNSSSRRKATGEYKSRLQLHHLQEEQTLRDRNAQLILDLEENELQLDIDCSTPPSTSLSLASSASSSRDASSEEELTLQKQDFELELALEVQHQLQNHQYDSTLLNESPSALQRHLERKLRHQKRLLSAYQSSLHQQAVISYNSQECVAWRARQQQLQQKQPRKSSSTSFKNIGNSLAAAALTRFQQFHPNRRDLDQNSIFAKTLTALGQKRYTDPNGFMVELDPVKIMAGSRRASTYLNDDLHVLVLDMQWDPEVTVVVGNVLDETVKLRQEGYRPVMLNVANSIVPGGDYHLDSATDSEADLFRRTTLHQCLDQEPRRSRFYPLSEAGGVYCPNQAVFRRGYDRRNEFMDRFEWISVVSVAPIPKMETREKDGGLGGVQFLEGEDDLLRRRILAAMKVGVSQGHDALVLPPHGTEAGQNPSEAIAAIYRSIIGRDFMGGRKRFQTYKKIVMVLDPEQAEKIVNETSNYRPTQPPQPIASPLPVDDNEETIEAGVDAQNAEDAEQDAEEEDSEAGPDASHSVYYRSDDSDVEDETEENDDNADGEEHEELNSVREITDEMILHESERDENDTEDDFGPSEDELEDQAMYGASGVDDEAENELVPEDEVSEEEALLEEQELQEDVDLSEGVLAEDLNDIPAAIADSDEAGTVQDDDSDSNDETSGDDDDDNQGGDDDEEHEEADEEAEAEPFVPLVETVRQVFERMLEQRSLLIVKNRARGIVEPEVPAANATITDATGAPVPASVAPLSA
ncbi:hypothetical protein BG015_009890 [Linnemannia schmuckeri]|uniref:Microbial-type PARG catalytic domain-containing protein n=1 Tax=Linnemannia schmuckeri TaxID=64567 RepID=A0A9P5V906_9FUNG|nr:hypothetical protein BG015_009890 [Linnemannia schmuckeri]